MGTVHRPKEGTKIVVQTLKVSEKKIFKLTVHTNADCITFFIGGRDKYCIEIQIYPPYSKFKDFFDITNGTLSQIYYHEWCSLQGEYVRKADTLLILRLAFSLIHNIAPYVETISFKDTSEKEYSNGLFIQLSELYFITTGKTWYEENFNAILDNKFRINFENAMKQFQIVKETLPWDKFKLFVTTKFPIEEKILIELYNSTTSWQEFFFIIKTKIGALEFCKFTSPWLHTFLETFFKFSFSNAKYNIPIHNNDKINPLQYKILPFNKGGSYTRKMFKSLKL